MRGLKGILSALILLTPQAWGASINQLIIVKSNDNTYYDETIETLINNIDRDISVNVLVVDKLDQKSDVNPSTSLHIALGKPAAKAVSSFAGLDESISAYLTHEQYHELDFEIRFTVFLDQPLRRYLLFSKLMLQLDSIGVISKTGYELSNQQRKLLTEIKVDFNQYLIDANNKLLPALRELLMQDDALLMLPQQSVYNHDSLKGVLLASYRNRKPVISYSPAHVKAGALGSVFSSPTDIGKHLATIINKRLKTQKLLASGFEYARFYSMTTNTRVARSLGLNLPSKTDLRAKIDEFDQ
jgi:putative ABC transport system substrate-binding protein